MNDEQQRMYYNMKRGRISPGQKRVLQALNLWGDTNPRPATCGQIARRANVDQTYVQRLLKPLEQLGYIEVLRNRRGEAYHDGCIIVQYFDL